MYPPDSGNVSLGLRESCPPDSGNVSLRLRERLEGLSWEGKFPENSPYFNNLPDITSGFSGGRPNQREEGGGKRPYSDGAGVICPPDSGNRRRLSPGLREPVHLSLRLRESERYVPRTPGMLWFKPGLRGGLHGMRNNVSCYVN